MDASTFRDVMAQWPSGVTVVTTLDRAGAPHGMTASSFSSVSLDPPLVSICLTRTLYSHELIEASGVFGVNILAKGQADVGRRFAGMDTGVTDRFAGESWTLAETGVPLLDSALGWFDCRVVHAYPGGDHTIFVGEVVAGRAAGRSAPLLFHSRGWGQFADVLPDIATLSDSGLVAALVQTNRGDRALDVAAQAAEAGTRVRVADLTGGTPTLVVGDTASPVGQPWQTAENSSALVADPTQARVVLDAGVGLAELALDPTDEAAVAALIEGVAGIADRVVVNLDAPFGPDRLDAVVACVGALVAAGVAEIGLADTAGRATPLEVRGLLQEVVALARPVPVRMRLHDRDRLGLVKAITALKSGVRHFDTTLAGLDEAVATEDLIRLLAEVEVATPVDTAALIELARTVRHPVGAADTPATGGAPFSAPASPDATDIVGAVG
ncbi:flavin reductase [Nocardioides sp.]|uniref:flavin reductase n=1 Tax=Nocardioides sp. TaxID=35761 RepID=UPI00260BE711|nr:flavin reductase [Nocardioides sp.]